MPFPKRPVSSEPSSSSAPSAEPGDAKPAAGGGVTKAIAARRQQLSPEKFDIAAALEVLVRRMDRLEQSLSSDLAGIPTDLITLDQASQVIGLPRRALWQLVRDGRLRTYGPSRRTIRVSLAAVVRPQFPLPDRGKLNHIRASLAHPLMDSDEVEVKATPVVLRSSTRQDEELEPDSAAGWFVL